MIYHSFPKHAGATKLALGYYLEGQLRLLKGFCAIAKLSSLASEPNSFKYVTKKLKVLNHNY